MPARRRSLVLETTRRENYAAAARHIGGWWAGRRDLGKGLAMIAELRRLGVPVRRGVRGLRAVGRRRIESVAWDGGEIAADLLLLHDGVIPNTQISLALQLAHVWDEAQRCWRPAVDEWGRTSLPIVAVAGDAAGIAGAAAAVLTGRLAALDAAHLLGHIDEAERDRRAAPLRAELARERAIRPFLDALYRPADPVLCPADDVIVCRCEEVTAGQIRRAVRLGAQGPNQVKAFIRCGMGPCQGRICGPVASAVIARARGVPIEEVGTFRPRAPYKPITPGRAGRDRATPGDCRRITAAPRIMARTIMLTDRYGLPLSTNSSAARDAYVEGCQAKLTMYPGAIQAFDRAIAADPGFALAYAARAHVLLERGDAAAARASIAVANSLAAGLSAREASHVAFFDLLVAGDAEAALAAVLAHLDAWPRDAVALATTAFTNGLIGSSGRAGQKRMLLELLDRLAPNYGDDWWFTAHHGMALSENGQRDAARPKIERSLAQNPTNPWAAHASAHLCYEEGDPDAARAFLASWLPTYPREGALYSHLSWHLAMGHIEAGDETAALRLFREAFGPDVHSGPPRGKVTDAVSFLWRWELAGHPRDPDAWRIMYDFATGAFPAAGVAFSDMHIALAQIVAGDEGELAARARQIDDLARKSRYPSGPLVPAAARGFAAVRAAGFLRRDRRARTDRCRTRTHRRQPRPARFGRVHAVAGLSRREPLE